MRRIVYAPSFDREVEDIAVYIEEQFGERVRREFIADLAKLCQNVASFPGIGLAHHGYPIACLAVVFRKNWVFFDYDDEKVEFLQIADASRYKSNIDFSGDR